MNTDAHGSNLMNEDKLEIGQNIINIKCIKI